MCLSNFNYLDTFNYFVKTKSQYFFQSIPRPESNCKTIPKSILATMLLVRCLVKNIYSRGTKERLMALINGVLSDVI